MLGFYFHVIPDNPKRHEFNLQTKILFIDYMKAFDKVFRKKLWGKIRSKG
jgi:hypothetical protein